MTFKGVKSYIKGCWNLLVIIAPIFEITIWKTVYLFMCNINRLSLNFYGYERKKNKWLQKLIRWAKWPIGLLFCNLFPWFWYSCHAKIVGNVKQNWYCWIFYIWKWIQIWIHFKNLKIGLLNKATDCLDDIIFHIKCSWKSVFPTVFTNVWSRYLKHYVVM